MRAVGVVVDDAVIADGAEALNDDGASVVDGADVVDEAAEALNDDGAGVVDGAAICYF